MNPSLLFIGPGPGNPKTAGNCLSFIKAFHSKIPIFGLCLGMQAINEYFGGTTYPLQKPVHGLASSLHITNAEYSKWQNSKVARYHSLACKLADNIELLAEIENIPMMIRQKESKMAGVQFHPESFLSENGKELLTQLIGDIYE